MASSQRPASAVRAEVTASAPDVTAHTLTRAKHLRLRLKIDAARESRLGRQDAAVTQDQLALDLGVTPTIVKRTELPDEPQAASVLHVVLGPRAWALRLLRWQAAPHRALVVDAPPVVECSEPERTYALQKELLDVLNVRAENLRDGGHDLAEAERELVELRQALAKGHEHEAHLVALVAKLRGSR